MDPTNRFVSDLEDYEVLDRLLKLAGFDPDQERDDHGRWTAGGGGSGALDGMLSKLPVRENPNLPMEANTRTGQYVEVGPKFHKLSPEMQREVLTHEAAHFHGLDDWYLQNKSDWNLVGKTTVGHLNGHTTPGEIISEAYALSWHDPEFLAKNAPALVSIVKEGAEAVGLPLPPKGDVKLAGFDPDEARDEHGRWTDSGGAGANTDQEWKQFEQGLTGHDYTAEVKEIVLDTASKMGFPPEKVVFETQDRTFELNGKSRYYAGYADLSNGEIHIFLNQVDTQCARGIMVHEIEHQKFFGFMAAYEAEYDRFVQDARNGPQDENIKDENGVIVGIDKKNPMDRAGYLRDEFAGNYPVLASLRGTYGSHFREDANFDNSKMYKEDGVSEYSREWWDEWHAGKAGTDSAFHETLAEMARIKYETGKLQGSKNWRAYFAAVEQYARAHGYKFPRSWRPKT